MMKKYIFYNISLQNVLKINQVSVRSSNNFLSIYFYSDPPTHYPVSALPTHIIFPSIHHRGGHADPSSPPPLQKWPIFILLQKKRKMKIWLKEKFQTAREIVFAYVSEHCASFEKLGLATFEGVCMSFSRKCLINPSFLVSFFSYIWYNLRKLLKLLEL